MIQILSSSIERGNSLIFMLYDLLSLLLIKKIIFYSVVHQYLNHHTFILIKIITLISELKKSYTYTHK